MTAYKHKPTCIVPAASQQVVNDYLERQGLGRCFSIPLAIGAAGELVKDSEPLVTHYGTTLRMTDDVSRMVNRLLTAHGGERIEKPWRQAIIDRGAKRDSDSHPYQIVLAILSNQRAGIITRLKTRYPDADARFFKIGLSPTGTGAPTRYIDWLYASPAFRPLLDQIINQVPPTEVFIGCRDGNVGAVRALYGEAKYQGTNPATRTAARVWIAGQWSKDEVLTKLGLKIVV